MRISDSFHASVNRRNLQGAYPGSTPYSRNAIYMFRDGKNSPFSQSANRQTAPKNASRLRISGCKLRHKPLTFRTSVSGPLRPSPVLEAHPTSLADSARQKTPFLRPSPHSFQIPLRKKRLLFASYWVRSAKTLRYPRLSSTTRRSAKNNRCYPRALTSAFPNSKTTRPAPPFAPSRSLFTKSSDSPRTLESACEHRHPQMEISAY
jgi:hypothetical protein